MFKLLAIAIVLLGAASARAQEGASSLRAAFFSTAPVLARVDEGREAAHAARLVQHHGFYAAPSFGVTRLDGSPAALVGVRAAWLANRTVGVGLALNALANQLDERRGRALGGYGGLFLQHVFGQGRVVHGSVDTTVGAGAVCRQRDGSQDDACRKKSFFVFEPLANLELDLARSLRLSLGAGYRLAIAGEQGDLSSADLSGFVARAALELGAF